MKFALDGWNSAKSTPIGLENFDVLADLAIDGSLTTRYFRDDRIDGLTARIDDAASDPEAYWILSDQIGSVRKIVDAAGDIVNSIAYDAYGNIIAETNAAYRGRYAFTGREIETEANLQYNRARYYDSATGQWLSKDPTSFISGDSNLYRYASNRPESFVDPSGLRPPIPLPPTDYSSDPLLRWLYYSGYQMPPHPATLPPPTLGLPTFKLPLCPTDESLSLTLRHSAPPITFFNGGFVSFKYFELTRPSDSEKGGFILQDINATFDIKGKDGNSVKHPRNVRWGYTEAWRVDKNSTQVAAKDRTSTEISLARMTAVEQAMKKAWMNEKNNDNLKRLYKNVHESAFKAVEVLKESMRPVDDTWLIDPLDAANVTGKITFTASYYYVDGIDQLPKEFLPGGGPIPTNSGGLLSLSFQHPNYKNIMQGLFNTKGVTLTEKQPHTLTSSWTNVGMSTPGMSELSNINPTK